LSIQHGPSVRLTAEEGEPGTTFRWSPSRSAQTLSLPEQIAETIGNAIIKGDLEPGQRIQEQTIATQFDVSRGPVREALRILERDGMVRILPRRGAQVTQLSIDEVSDVFAIRASLVGLVARLIAENPDPELLARLRQRAERLNQLANSDSNADQYVQESYYMNMSMASGCGNSRLRDLIYSLAHQTVRYSRLGLSTKERRLQSAKLHSALVRALHKGDAPRAQETAEKLVLESRAMAIALLRQQQVETEKKPRKR
jgi:DNA-binding GntR family transcriptional regulator